MKRVLLLTCLCCTLAACNRVEKQAAVMLQSARTAYGRGDYTEAKTQIDSIKVLYPKAFKARRAANKLKYEVEWDELGQNLAWLDSTLQARQARLDSVKGNYLFEKDGEYQDIGSYIHPSQVIEKNLHRSFLRFQVDETGLMRMTSIYCGSYNIHHTAVKVTAPDGTFAETPASDDSYETTDLDEKIEKADYKAGEDGNVMAFISSNSGQNLRVQYLGERPYTTTMLPADREAAAAVYELSQLLSSITGLQEEIKQAGLKREFIQRKLQGEEEK
ncbi:MAG: hypothetical protein LUC23_00940 [Prevotellaceae bacterium]|nr:hypothetical protein [Prevotellaceae bacterium]